ncbi:NAD-dependent epimerase/dehydratase family protein [Geothrix paludis]|uniref:NAD-dependent epimerase/dehydratase family protein n=1 Tax=Geothrix paludis TaxID=2922722 RepID=UPI001FACAB06|nr:NAD(P)-dependent oxidoreductase [Geothrix paludis]
MTINPEAPIAVLGGSGFIGTRLAARLVELDRAFRIGDLVPSHDHFDCYRPCDVRVADSMSAVLSGAGAVINLAAEHRDDVRPISRYHETNVEGARQVCRAASAAGIKRLVFTSSVAVYGFQGFAVDESGPFNPFNPYGETKLLAEGIYRAWAEEDPERALVIIRPTVVFGEGNRGNVYNLLKQVASGRFMMVGKGLNKKSMAYVGNVADALVHGLSLGPGTHIFNYVDGPDMDMNELVTLVYRSLGRPAPSRLRIPLSMAMAGGHLLDGVARLTGRTFPISAIRVRKFCENTQIKADRIRTAGFQPRFTLAAALDQTIREELTEGASAQ